jgi:flagellar biosynthesis protein FlhF
MVIKSFVADTVAGALKKAKSELGADAVILKTRMLDVRQQTSTGGKAEVTACVDTPEARFSRLDVVETPQTIRPAQLESEEKSRRALEMILDLLLWPSRSQKHAGSLGRLYTALLSAGYPEFMADSLLQRLADRYDPGQEYSLIAAEAVSLLTRQLPRREAREFSPGQKVVIVGPPGAGKTSLLGKIANHLLFGLKLPVTITSLDHTKISAPEELETYADLLGVPHFEMGKEVDKQALAKAGSDKITLIDTPGMGPGNDEAGKLLREKLRRLKPERIVCAAPTQMRTEDLHDLVSSLEPCGMTDIAVTMLDLTKRHGGIVSLPLRFGMPIRFASNGGKVSNLTVDPDLTGIIRHIVGLPREVTKNE